MARIPAGARIQKPKKERILPVYRNPIYLAKEYAVLKFYHLIAQNL